MPSILFKCPSGGVHAHAWIADGAGAGVSEIIAIDCPACRRIHYYDPAAGTLLGGELVQVAADPHANLEPALPRQIAPRPLKPNYRNIALALAAIGIAALGWIIAAAYW